MCPCRCHPHNGEHPLPGCCACCPSPMMLDSYDHETKEFRVPARDGNHGGRQAALPWSDPNSDPAGDVRSALRDAELHAPCQNRIAGLQIDLTGRDRIIANQRATIEQLQRELREAKTGAGIGRRGWGQR